MWLWGYPCNFTIESLLLCVKLQEPKALLEDHNKDTKADGKHESGKLTGKWLRKFFLQRDLWSVALRCVHPRGVSRGFYYESCFSNAVFVVYKTQDVIMFTILCIYLTVWSTGGGIQQVVSASESRKPGKKVCISSLMGSYAELLIWVIEETTTLYILFSWWVWISMLESRNSTVFARVLVLFLHIFKVFAYAWWITSMMSSAI